MNTSEICLSGISVSKEGRHITKMDEECENAKTQDTVK